MSIYETISDGIKEAMRAKDREKLSALRDIKSKLMLEATKTGIDGSEISDDVAMKILSKLHKQRMETAELYSGQGRSDLQAEELAQAKVIGAFLPEPMSESEIEDAVKGLIQRMGASGMGDMGKVMGAANAQLGAQADGSVIAKIVKAQLLVGN
jgi:uncharacterized protein YqeY